MAAYNDLEITISHLAGHEYTVSARGTLPTAQPHARFELDLESPAIRADLELIRSPRVDDELAKRFGGLIFEKLFSGAIKRAYDLNLVEARASEKQGVRITLDIADSAEDLQWLPWTMLYDPARGWWLGGLAAPQWTPLSFSVKGQPPLAAVADGPLRLLVLGASPLDLPLLAIEQIVQEFKHAWLDSRQLTKERAAVAVLTGTEQRPLTRERLRHQLAHFRPHILHFIGHVPRDERDGLGIYLETGNRASDLVSVEAFADVLQAGGAAVRLVVVIAGDSATIARHLARQGLQAIGLAFPFRGHAAWPLSKALYAAIAGGRPVDEALNRARSIVRQQQPRAEQDWFSDWISPALYLPHGHVIPLIRGAAEPGPSPPECQAPPSPPLPAAPAAQMPPVAAAPATPSARGQAPPPLAVHEDVQFTVYRPRVVEPLKWETLLAFAHLSDRPIDAAPDEPDPIAEVRRRAGRLLGDRAGRFADVRADSASAIPDEAEITFVPFVPGCDFNPTHRTFLWFESVHQEEFRMRADAGLDGRVAQGRFSVFWGSLLLAEIQLNIRVDSRGAAARPPAQAAVAARPFDNIFASYSHRDEAVVEEMERAARTLGHRYLRDITDLRAGEVWSRRLEKMIRGADVFQLFWSWNAMRSTHVEREWRLALSLGRPNYLRPTYWEDPLPSDPDHNLPPPELTSLHFARLYRPAGGGALAAFDIAVGPAPGASRGSPARPAKPAPHSLPDIAAPAAQVAAAAPRPLVIDGRDISNGAPSPSAARAERSSERPRRSLSVATLLLVALASLAQLVMWHLAAGRRPLSSSSGTPPVPTVDFFNLRVKAVAIARREQEIVEVTVSFHNNADLPLDIVLDAARTSLSDDHGRRFVLLRADLPAAGSNRRLDLPAGGSGTVHLDFLAPEPRSRRLFLELAAQDGQGLQIFGLPLNLGGPP